VRVLAVDLGSKRIGIAVSDRSGTIAAPLTVVARSGNVAADHRRIAQLVVDEEAERVVVGLPLNMNGSAGPAAKAAMAEADALATVVGVPVETYDERRTTVTAAAVLQQRGLKAPARRELVDKVAAAVLLQNWLDSRAAPR
jgi:putative Holliday junction resolvase